MLVSHGNASCGTDDANALTEQIETGKKSVGGLGLETAAMTDEF